MEIMKTIIIIIIATIVVFGYCAPACSCRGMRRAHVYGTTSGRHVGRTMGAPPFDRVSPPPPRV